MCNQTDRHIECPAPDGWSRMICSAKYCLLVFHSMPWYARIPCWCRGNSGTDVARHVFHPVRGRIELK